MLLTLNINLLQSIITRDGLIAIQLVEVSFHQMGIFILFGIRGDLIMMNIAKKDIRIVKTFVKCPYPKFITALDLDMDIDYLVGLCTRFISRSKSLDFKLFLLEDNEKTKIENYIKNGDDDDKIYYFMMLAVQDVLNKYYDYNGNWKIN